MKDSSLTVCGSGFLSKAAKESWSVRVLDRDINTQCFERHFKQPQLPAEKEKEDKTELLKSPTIADFLGFKQDESYRKKHRKQFIIFALMQ